MIEVEVKGHGIVEFPDGTPNEVITSALQREFPTEQKQQGNRLVDMLSSGYDYATQKAIPAAGTASAKAIAGVLSLPNSIGQLGQTLTGGENKESIIPSPFDVLAMIPSYSDIQSGLLEGTGTPEYKPDSALGKIGMEAVAMAGSGALTPIGATQKLSALLGGLSGAGGETARQQFEGTEYEPYAQVGGAILAPMTVPSALSRVTQIAKGATGNLSTQPEINSIIANAMKDEGIEIPSAIGSIVSKENNNLANISSQLQSEAVSASRQSPIASNTARELSQEQLKASRGTISDAVTKYISDIPDANLTEMTEGIIGNAKKIAQEYEPAVSKELSKGFTETAPRRTIAGLVDRFPDVAKRIEQYARETKQDIDFSSLRLKDLNTIKKGIDTILFNSKDDLAGRFVNNFGKVNEVGTSLLGYRAELNNFLRKKAPSLAKRNDMFSDEILARRAAEDGFRFLSDKPRESVFKFSDMSQTEKDAFRGGMALYLKQELIPNLGFNNATNTKRLDAASQFIGKKNSDRLKAIIENEQKIQQQTKDFRESRPRARGIAGGGEESVTRGIMQATATKTPSSLIDVALKAKRKLLEGKGADYQKRLAEDLTRSLLTTDRKETARTLSGILREQNNALKMRRSKDIAGNRSALIYNDEKED